MSSQPPNDGLLASSATDKASGSRWGVLALCAVAQFMVVLDVSIVNVALPQMKHDLSLSLTGQQWVVNAYTLTFAGFLMLGGRASDFFGRRRIFILGLGLFTLASLVGGIAQTGAWLITARAFQGIGGAVLSPASLTVLTSTFTEPSERRRALGIWSATAACGAAAGVLFGGILTDLLDWRWVLFVNVPIGLAGMVVTPRVLTELRSAVRTRLDIEGAFTLTIGLALFVYGIVGTDTHSWGSSATIIALAGGALFILAALLIEAKTAVDPILPLSIFKRRSLSAANAIAVCLGVGLFGMYFFISLYLQQAVGYSPLRCGLAILPAGLLTLVAALNASRLVTKIGARNQLILGPAIAGLGLVWMSFLHYGNGYWAHTFGPLLLFGFGVGLTFVPMTLTATAGVPPREGGLASGLINTTRQIGGAVGLAALATLANSVSRSALSSGHGADDALTIGYDRAFLIAGIIMFVGAALALLIRTPPRSAPSPATASPALG